MSKLNIAGRVVYNDSKTPVPNAQIKIYDLDTGGNGNDLIFTGNTDGNGRFQGRSKEWEDPNDINIGGFRVPTPDILNLHFRVRYKYPSEGNNSFYRTHSGPFFHLGNNKSIDIILPDPFDFQNGPVKRRERELIHLITLSEQASKEDRFLYKFIEFAASSLTTALLSPNYHKVRILEKQDATLDNLKQELESVVSQREIRAVDLIISPHGSTDVMYFYPNERTTMDQVAAALQDIPDDYRSKFRILFSTACFGASHRDEWITAGFEVASGSRGLYADSASSYPAFLSSWIAGATFEEAINAANVASWLRLEDRLTGGDSFRFMSGNGKLRIDSVP